MRARAGRKRLTGRAAFREAAERQFVYASVVEVEKMLTSQEPVAVVAFINFALTTYRRPKELRQAMELALIGKRSELAAMVSEDDLKKLCEQLRGQEIDGDQVEYRRLLAETFARHRPLRKLYEEAKRSRV